MDEMGWLSMSLTDDVAVIYWNLDGLCATLGTRGRIQFIVLAETKLTLKTAGGALPLLQALDCDYRWTFVHSQGKQGYVGLAVGVRLWQWSGARPGGDADGEPEIKEPNPPRCRPTHTHPRDPFKLQGPVRK
jgi:hypothetical protein